MAEKKPNYIPFFFDDVDALDELGDAERGRLLTSLLKYGETGAAEKLCGNERFVYKMFCGRIDRFFESYENKCRKNSANVSKRYEATDEYDGIRTNTTVYEELPKLPSKSKSKSKSKYNPNPEDKKRAGAFTPPSMQEIEDYCKEKQLSVDPKQFFDYFTEGEWKDAKGNKVKNWKQKLLTWDKFDRKGDSDGLHITTRQSTAGGERWHLNSVSLDEG